MAEESSKNILIVGLGLAGVRAFSSVVDGLYQAMEQDETAFREWLEKNPLNLTLVDQDGAIGGPAYDRARSPVPLLIHNDVASLTPVGEFQAWLGENRERIHAYLNEFGDRDADGESTRAAAWLKAHANDLKKAQEEATPEEVRRLLSPSDESGRLTVEKNASQLGAFDEGWRVMRIPRAIYGLFLHDEIEHAMQQLQVLTEESANIKCNILQGAIENVQSVPGTTGLQYTFRDNEATPLHWSFVGGGLNEANPAGENIIGASTDNLKFKPEETPEHIEGPLVAHEMVCALGVTTPNEWEAFAEQEGQTYFSNMNMLPPPVTEHGASETSPLSGTSPVFSRNGSTPHDEENQGAATEAGPTGNTRFHALSETILEQAKEKEGKVEIVVLGNRASAADLWVWTANDSALMALVKEEKLVFTHISTKGEKGVRPAAQHKDREYDTSHFEAALEDSDTAEGLFTAYQEEVARGKRLRPDRTEAARTEEELPENERKHSHYDIVTAINPLLNAKLDTLSEAEFRKWHGEGTAWAKTPANVVNQLNFLTAPETIEARDTLRQYDAVRYESGTFVAENAAYDDTRQRWSVPLESGKEVRGDLVVNTAGFQPYNEQNATLKPLFEAGLITLNDMNAGIKIGPDTLTVVPAARITTSPDAYPHLFILGITNRASMMPGSHTKRFTAAGNQAQLDAMVQETAQKVLENIGMPNLPVMRDGWLRMVERQANAAPTL